MAKQRLILVVTILASSIAFLDSAIINVALPAIRDDLGGGLAAQQWVVDAYLLTLGSFILIAGSLSDRFGRHKILRYGLIGFLISSILCAIAPNALFLIVARGLQGLAGALLVPSSLAIIISSFKGKSQGQAIGTWTAWTGIAFIIGPLLGGLLIDYSNWRYIFAINILPIAITLYLLAMLKPDKAVSSSFKDIDLVGSLLCIVGLAGPVFALIELPRYGISDPLIFLPLVIGLATFVGFLWYEKVSTEPMLPLELFRNHNFSVGNIATFAVYAGLAAATFVLVVYLQQVAGYSALSAGMALVPVTIILFVVSPTAGKMAAKYGPRLFMGFGPIIAAIGFLAISRVGPQIDYWTELLPWVSLFGLGLAITVAPLTAAILGDVPPNQAGIASSVNNAIARVAGLLAVAAVGAVIGATFASSIDNYKFVNLSAAAITDIKASPMVTEAPKPYNNDPLVKDMLTDSSVKAFRSGILCVVLLLGAGGVISLVGIRNPSRIQ